MRAVRVSARWFAAAGLSLALLAVPSAGAIDDGPFDSANRQVGTFNFWILQHVVKPLARGYNVLVPKLAQGAINSAILNLDRPRDVVNSLLQGKPRRAGRHVAAFAINSTIGLGGLLYVSPRVLDDDSPETFNETLGVWGVPSGPYWVIPFLGGSSPRDLVGRVADTPMNPLFWISGTTGTLVGVGRRSADTVNTVAALMPAPFAHESDWERFNALFLERTPYEEEKQLFHANDRMDVDD